MLSRLRGGATIVRRRRHRVDQRASASSRKHVPNTHDRVSSAACCRRYLRCGGRCYIVVNADRAVEPRSRRIACDELSGCRSGDPDRRPRPVSPAGRGFSLRRELKRFDLSTRHSGLRPKAQTSDVQIAHRGILDSGFALPRAPE